MSRIEIYILKVNQNAKMIVEVPILLDWLNIEYLRSFIHREFGNYVVVLNIQLKYMEWKFKCSID